LERGGCDAAPVLLLHSADDALAPAADVDRFAGALRGRGRRVTAVRWAASPHVGHLKAHPQRYAAAVAAWLADACATWHAARSSSGSGGAAEPPPALTSRL
jgi:dipeptidyl aminopeptidase/acylaminoacyl peptidase